MYAKISVAIMCAFCVHSCIAYGTDYSESEMPKKTFNVPFSAKQVIRPGPSCRGASAEVKVMTMRCSSITKNRKSVWAAWAGIWAFGFHATGHIVVCRRQSAAERMAKKFKACTRKNLMRRCNCGDRSCADRVVRKCGGAIWVIEEEEEEPMRT